MFPRDNFAFIIDTQDSNAGNAYRQLAAYCMGQWGEDVVGFEEAQQCRQEETAADMALFQEIIAWERQEDGCSRPSLLCETPGLWNDGIGHISPETILPAPGGIAFPAYCSVGIYFHVPPPDHLRAILQRRALAYARDKSMIITGFRIVQYVTHEETLWADSVEAGKEKT